MTVVDDRMFDGDRSIEIAADVAGWAGGRASLMVLDNEVTVLTLGLPETVSENAGVLSGGGTVSIPGIWASDLTVTLASDKPGQLAIPAVVTIPAGRMQVDFDIAVADDALINGDRAATVTAAAPEWTTASQTVAVVDNDPGALRFSADRFMAWEASGSAAVSVVRKQSSSGRITVDVETLDGSATAGDDYTSMSRTLVFEDGESEKTINIPVSADEWAEGAETIRISLSNPGLGATLLSPDTAELMLVEAVAWQDDAQPLTNSHLKGIWGARRTERIRGGVAGDDPPVRRQRLDGHVPRSGRNPLPGSGLGQLGDGHLCRGRGRADRPLRRRQDLRGAGERHRAPSLRGLGSLPRSGFRGRGRRDPQLQRH